MKAKLVDRGSYGELFVEGRIDSNNSSELEGALKQLAERFDNLTLDFSKLEYISSAGLRALLIGHKLLLKKDGELRVKNVSPLIMEVFEMTGFAGMFKVE